jgi:hypothetical protein
MRRVLFVIAFLAAPDLVAADKHSLSPIDTKAKDIAVAVPKDGHIRKATEITSAEELAKSPLCAAGSAEKLKKEVNFETEKLVVFAWTGSARDTVTGEFLSFGKTTFVAFGYTQGLTRDLRQHVRVFVVPKSAGVLVLALPPEIDEIPLKGLKIAFPEKPGGPAKPEVITSAAQLAESPALKGAAEEIGKHVDFDKQKLVFVAWLGSVSDHFTVEVNLDDTRLVVACKVVPGHYTDLHKCSRLFIVPKDTGVEAKGD